MPIGQQVLWPIVGCLSSTISGKRLEAREADPAVLAVPALLALSDVTIQVSSKKKDRQKGKDLKAHFTQPRAKELSKGVLLDDLYASKCICESLVGLLCFSNACNSVLVQSLI